MALALLALVLVLAWDFHRKWRQEEKEIATLIFTYWKYHTLDSILGSPYVVVDDMYCWWTSDPLDPERWKQNCKTNNELTPRFFKAVFGKK